MKLFTLIALMAISAMGFAQNSRLLHGMRMPIETGPAPASEQIAGMVRIEGKYLIPVDSKGIELRFSTAIEDGCEFVHQQKGWKVQVSGKKVHGHFLRSKLSDRKYRIYWMSCTGSDQPTYHGYIIGAVKK